MKIKISLLLSLLLFITGICFAEPASTPKRIAVLPIMNQAPANPALEKYLADKLTAKLHMPLNEILHRYEYIPQDEVAAVLPNLKDHALQPQELKSVAATLDADLVIGMIIISAYEHQDRNMWNDETYLSSYISLRLIGYDKTSDTIIDAKKHATYHGEYLLWGQLQSLAKEASTKLLNDYDFK